MLIDKEVLTIEENNKKIKWVNLFIFTLIELFCTYLLDTVNSILISNYSDNAVSAIGVCTSAFNVAIHVVTILVVGVQIVCSFEYGRKDIQKVKQVFGSGFILMIIVSFVITISFVLFPYNILKLFKLPDDLAAYGTSYFRTRAILFPLAGLKLLFNGMLLCSGKSKYTLIVNATCNILNVAFLSIVLYTNLIPEESKMAMCGLAVGLAQALAGVLAAVFIFSLKLPIGLKADKESVKRIISIGTPGNAGCIFYVLAQAIVTSFISPYGNLILTPLGYMNSVVNYGTIISIGATRIESIFVGRYKGLDKQDYMIRTFKQCIKFALFGNLVITSLMVIFMKPIYSIFTTNQDYLSTIYKAMLLQFVINLTAGLNHCFENFLSPCGDVKFVLITSVISCFVFYVGGAYLLINSGLMLIGFFLARVLNEISKNIVYIIRYKTGKWKNKTI